MKSFVALALVAAASAAPRADNPAPAPYQPAPRYAPAPYKPAYKPEPTYAEPPKYEFAYAVADEYAQTNFAQNEARDGYATNGGYRVNLPDGRTQIVTYTVQDDASGYVADVQYEGEAQYPKYEPNTPPPPPTSFVALALVAAASAAPRADNPAPAPYQPAPRYAPAPYKPAYKPEPTYAEPPKYEFAYAVADEYAQTNFAQNEARDGYATNGGYRVNLPDGRTQIVTYT
eukprot:maker-scaffold2697_size13174-snap-gene-0.3 protein:Tk09010 transcript:maker-scaffold2697_size13174-snap-gene-0.3-mRNA-1 annotation:"cuticle protein isoform b"